MTDWHNKQMFGVGSIPWSPLARGALSRPLARQMDTSRGSSDLCVHIMTDLSTLQL
jgi:aryl-alcohol dehydrogenase-like predicted oxidoreductase